MTLQDLIDELEALPVSARTATVLVRADNTEDSDVLSATYQGGEVVVTCDVIEDADDE